MNVPASRPLVLALALMMATLPAGLLGTAAAEDCPSDEFSIVEHITRSSPLSGQLSTTETVHQVAIYSDSTKGHEDKVNGVDAYVYTLGCEAKKNSVTYSLEDKTAASLNADYALAFYNDRGFQEGDTVWEDDDTGPEAQLDGYVPKNTMHVVVILQDGPLFTGMDHEENPSRPYSSTFELTLKR